MRHFLLISSLFVFGASALAQLYGSSNQYMLNQAQFNPGYLDVRTDYSATINARNQWTGAQSQAQTFTANGHYSFNRYHGIAMNVMSDHYNVMNQSELMAQYTFHAWVQQRVAIGMGLRMGFMQRTLRNDFIYFDPEESTIYQLNSSGFNMGTGLSVQSENFEGGLSLPYLFNNRLNKKAVYSTPYNHLMATASYKMRFSDYSILVPSVLIKGVKGAPTSISADLHYLYNQWLWLGSGWKSDNTIHFNVGVFLGKGFRFIYSAETASFGLHEFTGPSHELTLNYARTLNYYPFSKRVYTVRKGGKFRKKPKHNW